MILQSENGDAIVPDNPLPVRTVPSLTPTPEWVFVNIAAQAITAGSPVLYYTPKPGRRLRLMGYHVGAAAATSVLFKSGVPQVERLRSGVMAINGNTNSPSGMEVMGLPLGAVGDAFYLDLSGNTTIHGFVMLKEETP